MTAPPYVIGVDPSLTATGLAAVRADRVMRTTVVASAGKRGDSLVTRDTRITDLMFRAREWLPSPVALVVIEAPAYSRAGGSQWDRAGLWWRIVHTALASGLPVATCPPATRATWATGSGRADKAAVASALTRRFGVDLSSSDEADALVLALAGAHRLGWLGGQPAYSVAALGRMAWPEVMPCG